jgi:hypothetical protein
MNKNLLFVINSKFKRLCIKDSMIFKVKENKGTDAWRRDAWTHLTRNEKRN